MFRLQIRRRFVLFPSIVCVFLYLRITRYVVDSFRFAVSRKWPKYHLLGNQTEGDTKYLVGVSFNVPGRCLLSFSK